MPYGIYDSQMCVLQDGNIAALHALTDIEKKFFNDKGFSICDFKWSNIALIKPIGSFSVDYITLRLKAKPYRFVGRIHRISEHIPTVHGALNFSTDIDEVEADTLFDCYEKLMVNLRKILEIEKENYIKYIDSIMNI